MRVPILTLRQAIASVLDRSYTSNSNTRKQISCILRLWHCLVVCSMHVCVQLYHNFPIDALPHSAPVVQPAIAVLFLQTHAAADSAPVLALACALGNAPRHQTHFSDHSMRGSALTLRQAIASVLDRSTPPTSNTT